MAQINSIRFIKPEEVNSMASAPMEVTRSVILNKTTGVKREMYSAAVKLDRLTTFPLTIDSNEYALLHYHIQRKKFDDQFTVQAKIRIIETKWPERENRKAHSSFMIQVYVNDNVKWEFDITHSTFLLALQAGYKEGALEAFKPVEKIPGQSDKEEEERVEQEDPSLTPEEVASPEENPD